MRLLTYTNLDRTYLDFKVIGGSKIALDSVSITFSNSKILKLKEESMVTFSRKDSRIATNIIIPAGRYTIPTLEKLIKTQGFKCFITLSKKDEVIVEIDKEFQAIFSLNLLKLLRLQVKGGDWLPQKILGTTLDDTPSQIYLHCQQIKDTTHLINGSCSKVLCVLDKYHLDYHPKHLIWFESQDQTTNYLDWRMTDQDNQDLQVESIILRIIINE